MQCGLFPPKRFPIYKRTADTSEMDRRVDSWKFDCEGLIAVYKNWNAIIKETIKESQSERTINKDRFTLLQKKHECLRMAAIRSTTRMEVHREFMGDSSHLQL
ncbi:hypothetical protein PRIPAC_92417 [Pristionchus pacificus]|uniref:Uncharacterized protein n=1 Tax=Pristionchus pacificus TaxID=54126 RepID=A0A2A6BPF3_PRIPA|nr:hypothetical protein PRIPAC_92417 [Pristionchus pacificus]|eukprot:PDM67787.1 hypothetical protein PRIPAC_45831 [Pristionchus pacificus]